MLLEGKVALVTGAGSGLGAETARVFAEQGASVVLADVTDDRGDAVAAEIRDRGGAAQYVHVDVRRRAEIEEAVALAEGEYGKLDILVANAGIMGTASFKPSVELTDEEWQAVLDVNLSGAFRSFQAAIPALRRAGGGALSATSSVSGVYATIFRSAYTASKGGMNAIVRAMAVELAPDNIRVNGVAPGSMATNVVQSLGRDYTEIDPDLRPDPSLKPRVKHPGQDTTRDTANVHLFLCSHLANYVNGEIIVADGGFSVWNGT